MTPDFRSAAPEPFRRSANVTALCGSLFGALLVVLAAAGAHLLAATETRAHELWQSAQLMHLLHSLALLFIALSIRLSPSRWLATGAAAITLGTILFCGTLYLRAAWPQSTAAALIPANLAPAGGMLLIAGWLCLSVHFLHRAVRKNAAQ